MMNRYNLIFLLIVLSIAISSFLKESYAYGNDMSIAPTLIVAQNWRTLIEQANTAYESGNYVEAEAIWRRVIQLKPNLAEAYNNLGLALGQQGELEGAIAAYQKAIQLDPNLVVAYYNLGLVLGEQGELEEAIAAYQKAIELNPTWASAYNNLGLVLREQDQLDDAIAAFQKAIELNPKLAESYIISV
ncbi:tetratricopeptide repeat protein [Candidatus Gracilibacteria bacterium]|nr:tetratricopeptide repeat protein [Candidatus Gracilibacteria bacterium]